MTRQRQITFWAQRSSRSTIALFMLLQRLQELAKKQLAKQLEKRLVKSSLLTEFDQLIFHVYQHTPTCRTPANFNFSFRCRALPSFSRNRRLWTRSFRKGHHSKFFIWNLFQSAESFKTHSEGFWQEKLLRNLLQKSLTVTHESEGKLWRWTL